MADEVVGSARIRIEPDLAGFDAALLSELESAVSEANGLIVAAFRDAASSSSEALSGITDVGFGDVTTSAEAAANEITASFSSVSSSVASELESAASEGSAALAGIGDGVSSELVGEFTGVGDQIAGEFSGVGDEIGGELQGAANQGGASFGQLADAGGEAAASLLGDFDGLAKGIVAALAAVGTIQVFRGFAEDAERVESIAGVTNQLIETTGGLAEVSASHIQELGDALERTAGIESEVVQEGANVLLTFKGVRNEGTGLNAIFDRTVRAGADLSAVLGGDLRGSTLQLGKALQDPVRGMNQLRRSGVDFTEQQREQVKALVDSNRMLEAQKVILDEVESQVGGAATAAAKASDIIRFSFGNIGEEIGAGLLPALDELAARAPGIVEDILPDARRFGQGLGEFLDATVDSLIELTPLLGTTGDLLSIVAPLFEVVADAVDAIPGPVIEAGAALLVANRALRLFTAAKNLSAISAIGQGIAGLIVPTRAVTGAWTTGAVAQGGFLKGLRGLTSGTTGATLALTAGFVVMDQWNNLMADARQEGVDFGNSVREQFDLTTMSASELEALSERLGSGISDLRSQVDDSFLGRNTINKDFNESIKTGADELERFQGEVDAAAAAIRQANAEAKFGPLITELTNTGAALDDLGAKSPQVTSAIRALRLGSGDSEQGFLDLAVALDEAALSEEDFATAASLVGVSADELQDFVSTMTGALNEFVDAAVAGLPTVATAFDRALSTAQESAAKTAQAVRDSADEQAQAVLDAADARIEAAGDALEDSGADDIREAAQARADAIREAGDVEAKAIEDSARITASGLTKALTEQAEELADFRRDLELITSSGFADVAGLLAQQGQEAGDALADELATALENGNVEILDGLRAANNAFRAESQQTIEFIRQELAPQFLSASGLLASAITDTFGENLDFAEKVRISAALARSGLTTEGQAIAAIAAVEGERAAREYGAAFGIEQEVIDEAVAAGVAIQANAPTGAATAAGAATGIAFADGVALGITWRQEVVNDKAQQLVLQARAAARRTAQEGSPSRLFATLGENMALGVAEGLEDSELAVVRAAEQIVQAAARAAERTTITPTVTADAAAFASTVRTAGATTAGPSVTGSSAVAGGTVVNELIARLGGSAPLVGTMNFYEARNVETTARAVEARLRRIQLDLQRKD